MDRRILLVSASYGTGHDRLAKIVADRLGEAGAETKCVQVFGYAPGLVRRKSRLHRFVHRRIPAVYNYFWSREADRVRTRMPAWMYRSLARPADYLQRQIEEFGPEAILCTHLYGGAAVARLRREGRISPHIRVYSVLTEFCLYPNWEANNELDGVFIPLERMIPAFLERGYRREQLIVAGLPAEERFTEKIGRGQARAMLGIEDRFTLLCLSGGECLSSNLEPIRELERAGCLPQVLAVCGRNEREFRRIGAYARERGLDGVRVFGYADNLDVMIDAADLVLSRGGFGTLSELLVKGAGIVLREKLVAQERRNAAFLQAEGAAAALDSLRELPGVLTKFSQAPQALCAMRERAKLLADPGGIGRICAVLLGN